MDLGADVGTTLVTSKSSDNIATILIDSLPHDHDLTVTPAFPNFPTDEEIVMKPDTVILLEPNNDISEQQTDSNASPTTSARPSPQASQLLDELKYLLKPTNSLARPDDSLQASVRFHNNILYKHLISFIFLARSRFSYKTTSNS